MISRKKLEEKGFLNFQIEEIVLAEKNGVSEELIHQWLENVDLDNYQMMQVRKGLQDNLDVSLYARKDIPHTEMERIRLQQLEEKQKKEEENAKVKEQKKIEQNVVRTGRLEKIKSFLVITLILFIFAGLGFAGYLFRDTIAKYFEDLDLVLSETHVEVPYGSKFNAADYVVSASDGEEIIQIWPTFSTDELGEFDLQYVITNNVKAVKRHLKVKVVDDEAPVIKLSESRISLTRGVDDFNGFKYIDSVSDNYDSSPKVEIGQIDWSKRNQDIEYKVSDSEGNVTIVTLSVDIKNKPQITQPVPETQQTDTQITSSSETSSGGSSSSSISNSDGNTSSSTTTHTFTYDYEDYQPSNGEYDIHITDDQGETVTITGDDNSMGETPEDLIEEACAIFGC